MSAAPVISSALRLKLKVTSGPHLNEIYSLENKTTKIGRAEDNDIKLVNDGRISRHHVEIYLVHSQFKFKNISQKNFVTIDGKVMEEGLLLPGQLLQVGETTFEVFSDGPELVSNEENITPSATDDKSVVTVRVPLQAPVTPVVVRPAPLKPLNSAPPTPLRPMPMGNSAPPLRSPPPMGATQISRPSPARTTSGDSKLTFYVLVLGALGFFVYLALGPAKPKEVKTFRTSQQVEYDLLQSSDEKKKLQERLETMQTTAAKRAQENLIKGFRDYQQGNFARARDNFQVVLNLDPDNVLAKRYFHLSKIKFDELLQFHILQGLRYRDKKNFRLCRSSFQSALVMIQNNQQHPKYREVKNFFDECNLALEGRF